MVLRLQKFMNFHCQPFLGIDFGTDFPLFLEAISVHFSNLLVSFFDTFQALIFGWIFDIIFERFWSEIYRPEGIRTVTFCSLFSILFPTLVLASIFDGFLMIFVRFGVDFGSILTLTEVVFGSIVD